MDRPLSQSVGSETYFQTLQGVAHSSTHRYRHNCPRIDPYQRLRVNPHTCVTCRIGGIDPKVAQFVHLARRRECRGGQSLAGNPFLRQGKGLGFIVCRLIVNLFAVRSTAGMVAPQLSNFPRWMQKARRWMQNVATPRCGHRVVQESLWFWWREEITILRLVVLCLVCDFG